MHPIRALLLLPSAALGVLAYQGRPDERPRSTDAVLEATTAQGDDLEAMRDEIARDVEELRGLRFTRPVEVRVTTKREFVEYARERGDKVQSAEERKADETVARLFGLIPADMDLEETMLAFTRDQVGGYYEPSEDTFYVVEGAVTGDLLRITLAHELTHALDDQHFDIDGHLLPLARENADAAAAYHAVVEGSGTAIMNRWLMPRLLKGELSAEDMAAAGGQEFGDAPEYLWKPLLHSYMHGAAFLNRTDNAFKGQMSAPKNSDIDAAFQSPPRSTEQVLHPKKYWDADERDDPRVISLDRSRLLEGWTILREDTMGELGLALMTRPPAERERMDPMAAATTKYTTDAAEGWGGDRFVLAARGDARIVHLVSEWDSVDEAGEFTRALEGLSGFLDARAKELGDGVGGFRVRSDPKTDRVDVTSWCGVDDDEVDRVLASLGGLGS
jgi:hypothetical protein